MGEHMTKLINKYSLLFALGLATGIAGTWYFLPENTNPEIKTSSEVSETRTTTVIEKPSGEKITSVREVIKRKVAKKEVPVYNPQKAQYSVSYEKILVSTDLQDDFLLSVAYRVGDSSLWLTAGYLNIGNSYGLLGVRFEF